MSAPRDPKRLAATMYFLAGAAFLLAGVLPLFHGRRPNTVFLALAPVWIVLGAAMLKRKDGDGPGEGK